MEKINNEAPSVHCYINILQSIIGRMASNSSASKTWCITLVSAIIIIVADKNKPNYIWISIIPVTLFFLLDSYYLGLERQFRGIYSTFIKKLHSETANTKDVYIINPNAGLKITIVNTIGALGSISVWPFYLLFTIMLVIARLWII